MPPQSKKRNQTPAAVVIGEAQDYTDPLKKLAFNPGQTLQEKMVAGARRAEGKPLQPRSNRRAKAPARLVGRLATQAPLKYDENAAQAGLAEEDRLIKEGENYFKEIEREAQNYEQATWMPDVTLSATGGLQPGSGVVLSSMLRSSYKGMAGTLGLIGQTMEDAFGSDDMPTVLGQLGTTLKGIAQANEPTWAAYESARPTSKRGVAERTAGFITELGLQLPSMALAVELLGPAAGFGAYKVQGLRAAGEEDPTSLAAGFVQGAAEGLLLLGLGKTASVLEGIENPGAITGLLKRSPRLAQAGAQALGGMAQVKAAGIMHPDAPTPDWLDYLHNGISSAIMDPVVLGPSGKSRKATEAVTKLTNQPDTSSYNLELPADNLSRLRQDFWQPKDLPWDDKVTAQLLNRARMQFVDSPQDPEGVMYLNPQALLLFDRATEAALPGYKLITRMRQGEVWSAQNAELIAEQLASKSQQLKATIAQLPDGDPKLHELASGAVVYEALAEHLKAAVSDGRPLALRTIQQEGGASSWNPTAREFDQTVVGHESQHVQQQKVATDLGLDLRTLTSPGWLADHPIGARVIAGIGEPGNPLQSYDPVSWTTEAIAYAAQPGMDPGLGLSKQERGVLVGDYFAELMDQHGPEVMNQYWVGRMDREVAQTAWQRLYEAGRVKYSRDPVSGKRIGLEWRGVEAPRLPERVPENGWGMEFQPAWSAQATPRGVLKPELDLPESKVKDKEGKLIAVYHGTQSPREIRGVDPKYFDPNALYGPGFYTTQDAEVAGGDGGYASRKTPDLSPAAIEEARQHPDYEQSLAREIAANNSGFADQYFDEATGEYKFPAGAAQRWKAAVEKGLENGTQVQRDRWADRWRKYEQDATRGLLVDKASPHAYKVYLDIRNPFDLDAPVDPELAMRLTYGKNPDVWKGKTNEDLYQRLVEIANDGAGPFSGGKRKVNEKLRAAGYDGITHTGGNRLGRGITVHPRFRDLAQAQAKAAQIGGTLVEIKAAVKPFNKAGGKKVYHIVESASEKVLHLSDGWPTEFSSKEAAEAAAAELGAQYEVRGHKVWIAFQPEQVINAYTHTPLNTQPEPDYEAGTKAPTWFSGLERFVNTKLHSPIPAKQLMGMIKNGGLRPGELEATGIMDWLQAQGDRKVSREELNRELASRRVEVQEVWKRTHADIMREEKGKFEAAVQEWEQKKEDVTRRMRELEQERLTFFDRHGYGNFTEEVRQEYEQFYDRSQELYQELRGLGNRPSFESWKVRGETKYDSYVQPGEADNYRELLLTLPEKGSADDRWIAEDDPRTPAVDDNYRSVHFSEPNILAHVRMTDRKTPNGGKVLFIEEVQSDWHQAGAKYGYIGKNRSELDQVPVGAVPDAPFKKTWPELAMRRMIRYAAENGYDQVAWVRGEEADASVGGSSSWFYDRNLVNTVNNILKKWGVRVTAPVPPKIKLKQAKFLPADALGWARNSDGLISIYPIKDNVIDYNRQSENIPLDDLARILDEQSVADIRAAIDNQVNDFGSIPGFETATHSGKIQRSGIQVADIKYHVLASADAKKLNTLGNKYSFPITPEMREGVLYLGQQIPLNIQPDPDYDAAHPAGNVAAEATAELDPEITHLQQTNAPPQIRAEISQQTAAERKAYREVANLRARLRKNTELGILAQQMIDQAGVPQPELLNEIAQQRNELKQQHADALQKFRELRKQGNQRKQELAGQLSDNVQQQREAAKLAAEGRLANGDALPPLDTPLDQIRMSSEYAKHLANAAKDMLIASGVPILDSNERATHDQLIDAMKAGRTNYTQLTEVAQRYGMKDVVELFERFDQFASAAGRDLAVFGNIQRELNKLRGISPELDNWLDQQAPTVAEIDRIANIPGIARQLVNLNIGARVARIFTQAVNVQTGLANVLVGRTLVNLVDQTIEQASRSQRRTGGIDGEPVKFEQNSAPPLSTVISPIMETWRTAKDLWKNPYWFAHGKVKDGSDPNQEINERSARIAQELHPAYPELMRKFDSALSDEPIQTHLLPHAEWIRAQQDALQLSKNQVSNMPAGREKAQRLARIAEAEKRIGKHSQVVRKVVYEATRGLHKYLTLARMGERFVRTASLVATLDREAARAGYSLQGLDAAGELYKLPEEVVAKAVNESLRDTYGIRPDPNSRLGGLYHDYAHSDNPLWILAAAKIPFVGFMGNAAKAFIDHSPLGFARVFSAEKRDMSLAENREWAIRAMLGSALYAANFYYIWQKYDDAEKEGRPAEPWHEVAGVSVRNIPQLAPYAYVNDWSVRALKGLPAPDADSALEFANVVAGLDARGITGTFEWLDGLLKVTQDQSGNKLRKTKEELYKGVGDWFGAYATPLETYNSLGASFVENMRDVKETYGMGAGTLFAPLLNHIPVARERLQDRIDPFTGMPVRRTDWPATRELTGFTIMPSQSYPARIFQHAGIQNKDWIPFTGVPEVDRELVAAIGKLAAERGPMLEQVLSGRDLDEQIAMTYKAMTNLAKQAENQVAARHPGVYKQLKDSREMNRWQRRVQDKLRDLNGLPSRAEQYKLMEDKAKEFQQP